MKREILRKTGYIKGKVLRKYMDISPVMSGFFLRYLLKEGTVELWNEGNRIPTYKIVKRQEFLDACQDYEDGKLTHKIKVGNNNV